MQNPDSGRIIEAGIMNKWWRAWALRMKGITQQQLLVCWRTSAEFRNARLEVRNTLDGGPA